jgi:2-keto-3-deoxy-L-rhamnonate aldolase RhmA
VSRAAGDPTSLTGVYAWQTILREDPLRVNALKAKLREGRRVIGVLVSVPDPELVELFGHLGYDFAFLDAQHGGLTVDAAKGLIRAAELTGMTPLVRVPRNDPSVILEYLDAGAGGIIVPNVASPADAEAAVQAIKYPPRGRRGAATASRAARYGVTQTPIEYLARANEETMFVPLLEDREVLDVLPQVVGVDGVDVVLIGPADLALSMGIPGGWSDPRVQAEVDRIAGAARAAGRPAMIVALDPEDGRRLIGRGFQALIVVAGAVLARAARQFRDALAT